MNFKPSPTTRSLIRIAVFSAPLLAILWLAPFIWFGSDFFPGVSTEWTANTFPIPKIFLGFPLVLAVQWALNIFLFSVRGQGSTEAGKITRHVLNYNPYLISYGITLALVFLLYWPQQFLFGADDFNIVPEAPAHPFLISLAVNSLLIIIVNLFRSREQAAHLQIDNAKLQLHNSQVMQRQLQQQLQPHFLFNALYNLQLLIDDAPDQAKDYVSKLSSFLRTSVDYGKLETIKIEGELNFLKHYMDLQSMRFGKALSYEIDCPEALRSEALIPVFTFQVLAENAIKHNSFSPLNPLLIRIEACDDQHLVFSNLKAKKFGVAAPSTGTGLSNLQQRYQLLGLTSFAITETETQFAVTLPLLTP